MVQRVQQDDQDDEETHSLPRLPLLDSEPYNFSAGHGQAIADQACSPTSQSEREREGLTRRRFGRMSADHSSKSSKGNDENGFRNVSRLLLPTSHQVEGQMKESGEGKREVKIASGSF